MPNIKLSAFKGLAQHIVYEELSPEYCHTLVNLDVDDPVGRLSKRGGYTRKYADAFTDIVSAFEYKYPTSGETILIFNDNGTLKYYTDGTLTGSLTLPTGSALESNFRNQYFGFKDHVIITTGNGSTNHVLGFYYLKRVNSSNTGLFGNVEEFTGYKLLKTQQITPHGTFSRIKNIVAFGNFYYISFDSDSSGFSKWIEKRNSNFQLVERFVAHEDASDYDEVSLTADSTYIYVAVDDTLYRINPNGWVTLESVTVPGGTIKGIAVDTSNIYIVDATNTSAYDKTDFASGTVFSVASAGRDVTADPTGSSTHFWCLNGNTAHRRSVSTGVSHSSKAMEATASRIHYELGANVFVSEPAANEIEELDPDDFSAAIVETNTHVNNPSEFVEISGTVYVVAEDDGLLAEADTASIYRPDFITINLSFNSTGSLDAGTYFYKFSVVDVDGQESVLSDPVISSLSLTTDSHDIRIIANESQMDDFYRLQYINVYRAYSSTEEAERPATNYKFLKQIDINDTAWENNSTLNYYYYDFNDNTTETSINSTTYEENSGFSENIKPRYLNYKVHEWLNNQLHVANFYVDGTTYKSKIAKSQIDGPDVVPFSDTYDFNPYDGDEIKNLTTAYSRIYAMKNRKTGIFYNDVLERIINAGIADIDSYHRETDTIFLISDKGLFELNGSNIRDLTQNVITYFDSISSFTDATVFYRDDKKRLYFVIPENQVLIFNIVHGLYTKYNGRIAFRGYFKNIENEYIGFGKGAANSNHYFFELDDDTQDDGVSMSVDYETPLLRMSNFDGEDIELTKLNYRTHNTGTLNIKLYSYVEGSKKTLETISMEDPTSTSQAVKTKYLSDAWGEAFSLEFTGTATVFQLSSISIDSVMAGETANV